LVCAAACVPGPESTAQARGPRSSAVDSKALVEAHNRFRAKHCAAPLSWSPKVAASAQKWANTIRDRGCALGHSGGQYGENLAAGTQGTLDERSIVAMWYDEVKRYSFGSGAFSMKTGHFTQLVWRGTTQVGCGHSQCNGLDVWICQYDPPGNWQGQFRENVLPSGCRAPN
jgi:pathogenesis-related protein 1